VFWLFNPGLPPDEAMYRISFDDSGQVTETHPAALDR
jgi:hypothetical protein